MDLKNSLKNKNKKITWKLEGKILTRRELTKDEKMVIELLKKIIPNKGLVADLGYYIKDGELFVASNSGFEFIKEAIELLKRVEITSAEGITAKLEIKQK